MRGRTSDRTRVAGPGVELDLERVFRREYEPMHRLAFTLLRSDAEAEEVVQDAFMVIARRQHAIDNLGGYLRTTVVNGARKRLARRRVHDVLDERVGEVGTVGASQHDHLVDLVEQLRERERMAVVLRYYAGWNATEIGEALNCPAGTVRSMLHRALQELKGMLGDD